MKMFRKFISALLVCAMALTLLTACGSSGSSGSSSDSQDLVTAINAQLKANGSSITVTAESDLTAEAKKVAELYKQYSYAISDREAREAYEASLKEMAGSDKYFMGSEQSTVSATAAEFAEVIIEYAKEGKTAQFIGYTTTVMAGSIGGIMSTAYYGTVAVISYK